MAGPARILILGGGVGGTIVANKLARLLRAREAQITLVDSTGQHIYQPGFLPVVFGWSEPEALIKKERALLSKRVALRVEVVDRVDPKAQLVHLATGEQLPYDYLILATGARLDLDALPGVEAAHHFYTLEAALRLRAALLQFRGGRIVIGVGGLPYKCPPAPLEAALLLDYWLRKRGLRDKTAIEWLSPIGRAFTLEAVSPAIEEQLRARGIEFRTFFNAETVDPKAREVRSLEGETVKYDLLIIVPPHRGASVVERSGLGDRQGWLPTDRETLQVKGYENVYALGDGTNLPLSKAGSTAHFEAPIIAKRIAAQIRGETPTATYDGHVMCFFESGFGKGMILDFAYDRPPVARKPTRRAHWGKLLFNRLYWEAVAKARL